MRKRIYTRNVGVLLGEDMYKELVKITDKHEMTISRYIRKLVQKELNKHEMENLKNG